MGTVRLRGDIEGLNKFIRDIGKANEKVSPLLRDASTKIAEDVVAEARTKASSVSRQAALAAQSMKVKRDRIPVISNGGSTRLSSSTPRKVQPKGGDIWFGAEFGGQASRMNTSLTRELVGSLGSRNAMRNARRRVTYRSARAGKTNQFPPHRGRQGYFFWPTVRAKRQDIREQYLDVLDKVIQEVAD